jgi:hypothetical protein
MKTNYVLIDYENVQPSAMAVLDQEHFKVIVFVGAGQAKITFEVASALQQMGSRARYVRISGNGSNALDFHIAFYVGQLATQEPDAYFHIISKDTGFDPLIRHLKSQKVLAGRWPDVAEIPIVKTATAKAPAEKLDAIVANLQQRGAAKPRTVKTLSSTINTLFQKKLSEEELASLVQALQKRGVITIDDTKVSYTLPA